MADIDPLIRLAANAIPGERKYILLAGAGLSKDAGQHTAWDIVLEAAKFLRAAEGGDESIPIEDWFLASRHAKSSYPEMISRLYANPAEQQAFLDRMLTVKKPGRGHQAIAELYVRGVLRAIITTNFDPLLELALRERGIEPQVIASDADFASVSPLIHCPTARIYKPHGTLGLGTLRNTPADIEKLPAVIKSELIRVADDHGLIVLGYGGADPGLMSVLQRRRRNLYPVYWLHRETEPPASAINTCGPSLVGIQIQGAAQALENLIAIQDRLSRLSSTSAMLDPGPAMDAISVSRADLRARIRDFMNELRDGISRLSPREAELDARQNPDCDDIFLQALDATKPMLVEYMKLVSRAAEFGSEMACVAIREALHTYEQLYLKRPAEASSDFVSFLTQELFVMLISALLKNEKWQILSAVLSAQTFDTSGQPTAWSEFNRYIEILDEYRKKRRGLPRISIAHDIYVKRHTGVEPLADIAPFEELEDADWLLTFITAFSILPNRQAGGWIPRISLSTSRTPPWLAKMRSMSYAMNILPLLNISGNLAERAAVFKAGFSAAASTGERVWRTGPVGRLARFDRGLPDEFFTLP